MLHIYFGDGKGKTSAAIGLAVRAAGQNLRVVFAQFLKSEESGERKILSEIGNILLMPCPIETDFTFQMTESQKNQAAKVVREIFDRSLKITLTEKYDILILDEIFSAIQADMLDIREVISFLNNAPKSLEIVLTGHNPPESILSMGNYVSKIENVRHPFEKGTQARKGIEF